MSFIYVRNVIERLSIMKSNLWKLFLFCVLHLAMALYQENNCSSTYDTSKGMITLLEEERGRTCVWTFTADPGDTFVITFVEFDTLSQLFTLCQLTYLEIKDGVTEDSPSLIGPKMCYIIQSTAKIQTTTNGMWVKLVIDSSSFNVKLTALVRIEPKQKTYRTYSRTVTWQESNDLCLSQGGKLATNYPVPTVDLEQAVFTSSSPLWTGKAVTDWVWVLGCVEWKNTSNKVPIYRHSKYNQLSECAMACKELSFFLIQEKACYCLDDTSNVDKVDIEKCNITCPGLITEKCGGIDTYSHYQFKSLPTHNDKDGTENCAALTKSGEHMPKSCDIMLPFSCSFHNTTKTFQYAMTWHEAVEFCSQQPDSYGLATIPQLSTSLYDEPMWLSLTRGVDWGFPSSVARDPEMAFVGAEGILPNNHITYTEQLTNTSYNFKFICEFETPNCGSNLTDLDGNITSPNYPQPYNNSNTCLWTISTDQQLVFIIEFSDSFDVEQSDSCVYDYLQFTEVYKDNVKVLSHKYCGKSTPASFIARTNHIEVRFRADRSVVSGGFMFSWNLVDDDTARKWSNKLKKGERVNAGAIVGASMGSTLFVIIILCIILMVYRSRKNRKVVLQEPQGSSVTNALYGIQASEFDSTSIVNDNYREYANVPSPTKVNLKEEMSYSYEYMDSRAAIDSTAKDTQSYENMTNGAEQNMKYNGDSEGIVLLTRDENNTDERVETLPKASHADSTDQMSVSVDQTDKVGTMAPATLVEIDTSATNNSEQNTSNDAHKSVKTPVTLVDVNTEEDNVYATPDKTHYSNEQDDKYATPDNPHYSNEKDNNQPDTVDRNVVIGKYNYIYFENSDDSYEIPIQSPEPGDLYENENLNRDPLAPKVSNYYAEIDDIK